MTVSERAEKNKKIREKSSFQKEEISTEENQEAKALRIVEGLDGNLRESGNEEGSNVEEIVTRGGDLSEEDVKTLLNTMNFSLIDPKVGVVYGGESIMCGTRLAYVACTHVETQYILLDWIHRLEDMAEIISKLTTMISYHGLLPRKIVLDCDGLTFNRKRYTTGEYVGRNLFEGDDQFFIDTRRGQSKSKVSV
jgi:hypothetical protein